MSCYLTDFLFLAVGIGVVSRTMLSAELLGDDIPVNDPASTEMHCTSGTLHEHGLDVLVARGYDRTLVLAGTLAALPSPTAWRTSRGVPSARSTCPYSIDVNARALHGHGVHTLRLY